jgi:hypothetical protein
MARTISITGAGLEMVTIGSPFADSPSLVNIVLRSDSISPGIRPRGLDQLRARAFGEVVAEWAVALSFETSPQIADGRSRAGCTLPRPPGLMP